MLLSLTVAWIYLIIGFFFARWYAGPFIDKDWTGTWSSDRQRPGAPGLIMITLTWPTSLILIPILFLYTHKLGTGVGDRIKRWYGVK